MAFYTLPELAYDYGALEPHLSARILELHHDKHHKAYVDGANKVMERLQEVRASGDYGSINQLEKNLAFHLSGHILHSLLWKNLTPDSPEKPDGELSAAIDEHLGSFDQFRSQLTEAANNLQGSGWAALSWEPLGHRLIVEQVYDHQGNVGQGGPPLLVLDMWEHAFYLQYENRKAEWVEAFWHLVDWDDVATRFEKARQLDLALGG
ncbi:MAG TPA: superoxide dismutase [Acidimicrobiia bacterium]|jgi:Fe-Mn family superoxide dismutase|nr:superoxide dismutase [Acidimicrobiia bacterium]